jgi:DNA-binding XRE family transcriptional regulator
MRCHGRGVKKIAGYLRRNAEPLLQRATKITSMATVSLQPMPCITILHLVMKSLSIKAELPSFESRSKTSNGCAGLQSFSLIAQRLTNGSQYHIKIYDSFMIRFPKSYEMGLLTERAYMNNRNNLRKIREERLISKMELARLAGVSAATIERIERGETCRMETKRKIIFALGYTLADKHKVFPE